MRASYVSIMAAVFMFLACARSGGEGESGNQGKYKYSIIKYDKNNNVILKNSQELTVVERYYYGFPRGDIDQFDSDRSSKIISAIRLSGAYPARCGKDIGIYTQGTNEGGAVWAVIECK